MLDAAASSSTVHSLLLQESQQEIASLRSELYSTRRQAEDRRQAVATVSAARDSLSGQVEQLERRLGECRHQLSVLQGIDVQLAAIRDANTTMQRELELGSSARKILESELASERMERRSAEQAKAVIESDRSRLQKARDELSAQLRVAQQQAREAEAEQLHAEDEAATLRAELGALRASSSSAAADEGAAPHGGGQLHGGARAAWGEPPPSGHHAGQHRAGPPSSSPDMAAAAVAEAASLSRQLEAERSRAAALIDALHAARAEASTLQQQQQQRASSELSLTDFMASEALALRGRAEAAEARAARLEAQLRDASAVLSGAQQQQQEAAALQTLGHHVSVGSAQKGVSPSSAAAFPVSSPAVPALEAAPGESAGPSGGSPGRSSRHYPRVSSSGSITGGFSDRLAAAAADGDSGSGDADLLLAALERCQAQVGTQAVVTLRTPLFVAASSSRPAEAEAAPAFR